MRAIVLIPVILFFAACGGDDPYDVLDKGGTAPGKKAAPTEVQVPILSDQAAKSMINFKCTECHTNTRIKKAMKSKVEWEASVQRCKERGAKISPIDSQSLVNWLARKYGN